MSDSDSDKGPESSQSSYKTSTEGTDTGHTSESSFSLANSETRVINRSKKLLLCFIVIAAGAVGVLTYFLVKNEEEDDFRGSFHDFAIELADLVHFEAKNIYTAVDEMGTVITSHAINSNASWPNVTIPHFEPRTEKSNKLSRALQLSFVPLVKEDEKAQWEAWSSDNQGWIQEGVRVSQESREGIDEDFVAPEIFPWLWTYGEGTNYSRHVMSESLIDFGPAEYAPVWMQGPAPHDPHIIKYDMLSNPIFKRVYHGLWETRLPVMSEAMNLGFLYHGAVHDDEEHPHSLLLHPVYSFFSKKLHERDDIVAFIAAVLPWDEYFSNLMPDSVHGIDVVLHDTCGDHFTYTINGPVATFKGEGDHHDHSFNDMEIDTDFAPFLQHNFSDTHEHCEYDLRIFPTKALEDEYLTNNPFIYTVVIIMVFFFTASIFVCYDMAVVRRQRKVMASAKRTNAIVSSLFPSNVRDRILKDAAEQAEQDLKNGRRGVLGLGGKSQLKNFLHDEEVDGGIKKDMSKPIADLFPETTIMFGDLVGFTAWSSVREPTQVFTLLETLYAAFDDIARRRRVFKVETVGDCYVAVAGLPDPRPDHAVVMARFARDCIYRMNDLTKQLEVSLGPDTGELALRVGLHSGPVTAGVLRGDKSRFQLFGDTMNTTARVETTGMPNRVHMSVETAELLIAAGKKHWVRERDDIVTAKGKGAFITYWLEINSQGPKSAQSGSTNRSTDSDEDGERPAVTAQDLGQLSGGVVQEEDKDIHNMMDAKTQRLVDWNVDVLARLLKQVVARRGEEPQPNSLSIRSSEISMVLEEVTEIIELPRCDKRVVTQEDVEATVLSPEIMTQLRDYVAMIASLYRENPFHNFEHASHVTMSVVKLLSRIVAPDEAVSSDDRSGELKESDVASLLHDHTYGITSDPLTQFSCVLAALIHDVDHTGVPNTTLVNEGSALATVYKNKSVAEQNSVDISWNLLFDDMYAELRGAIFSNMDELSRFRQLVVNSVMATDIMDKDLKLLRNARWDKAFNEGHVDKGTVTDNVNRKATIVIEHLIQASDVAHTMQHWHIYRKWNERLFMELYKAYKEGRSEKNPADFWYTGEVGFFDFYIIPLAKKLKTCGVFGVSSDEYYNYALSNRCEWEKKGQEVVERMIARVEDMSEEFDD